jgi:Flp pilus assembly protein TadD
LVNCPDPQLRDLEEGLRLARHASTETPENATYLATLGMAHYRAGNPKAAVETLSRAVELRDGEPTARDWLLLAMAQGKTGQTDEALRNFRRGQQWMDTNCPEHVELQRIRQEAESVIGLPNPSAPSDAPVDSID